VASAGSAAVLASRLIDDQYREIDRIYAAFDAAFDTVLAGRTT